ncbi:GNAT family N-acetyltransferase (plasmid) [Streptomyces sp. BI20]|uniref:GNAT family N-acetyltransferase n=1 Tax=Streptomyces sp. BI20 TaxID=3403460 RepID=UPI003C72028F
MYPIRLEGDRVVLREFRQDDVDDVLAVIGDDAVTASLSFDSRTRTQAAAMIEGTITRAQGVPRSEYYLAITPRGTDDTVVGFVRIAFAGVQAAKLGYAVAARWWGRGYATDAARVLTSYAFNSLGLHRVSAAIGPDNNASMAVAARLGMQREGVLRDHVHTGGVWRDSVLYSVLAHEWAGTPDGPASDETIATAAQ